MEKTASEWTSGDNWSRNESDPREFEFIINGKELDDTSRKIKVEPLLCISGVCELDLVEDVVLEEG